MQLDSGRLVAFAATAAVGLLAGILVGTALTHFTARGLPEQSWVHAFQLEDRLFGRLMPPFMLGTLAMMIAASLMATVRSRLLFAASALLLLVMLVVTVGFEVPLNRQIQSWTAGSAPPVWRHVRDLWLTRHLLRTAAVVLSFLAALTALAF